MMLDNTQMTAAGVKKIADDKTNLFGFDDLVNEVNHRNPLATRDINGAVKINRFGQRMQVEERLVGMAAGELKDAVSRKYQQQNASSNMADCFRMGAMEPRVSFPEETRSVAPSHIPSSRMPANENYAPEEMAAQYAEPSPFIKQSKAQA